MKTFFSTMAGFVIILILASVIVGSIFWTQVPDILASNLSKKMLVPVEIDSIGLGWGKIHLNKIEIGNPPNTTLAKAFTCKEILVDAPFFNYINKDVIVHEINLKDIYLGLEFDSASSTKGNWTTITKNIQSTTTEKSTSKQKSQTPSTARTVLIHRLVLTNINVDVIYKKEGSKIKKLPQIERMEFTNISSEGGLPMNQIMNSVLGEMLKQIFIKENLKNMIEELIDTPNPLKPYIAPFKGLFGQASE